jgi:hypothetical protein
MEFLFFDDDPVLWWFADILGNLVPFSKLSD